MMGGNMASCFDVTWKRRAIVHVEPLSMQFVSHEGRVSQGAREIRTGQVCSQGSWVLDCILFRRECNSSGVPYLSRVPAKPALHYRHLLVPSGLGNWGYARDQYHQLTCLVLDACDQGLTLDVVADQNPRLGVHG